MVLRQRYKPPLPREQLILATLAYADIFDYPLTESELRRWMIGSPCVRLLRSQENYRTLPGRTALISMRKERDIIAQKKWEMVRRFVRMFYWLPTLRFIGVTGGLAMNNAKEFDDIDLFFITASNSLWITRLLVTVTAEVFGIRRRPNDRSVKDKVCLNMFMAEDALSLPAFERDLFAAHEVLQMKPLWDRDGAYNNFLSANSWVKDFLPNAWKAVRHEKIIHRFNWLQLLEPFARVLQMWYMRHHRTTEVIRPGVLRFHPKDARVWVKKKYAIRLKRYNIPLDNIFYHR